MSDSDTICLQELEQSTNSVKRDRKRHLIMSDSDYEKLKTENTKSNELYNDMSKIKGGFDYLYGLDIVNNYKKFAINLEHRIVLFHEKTGIRTFDTAWEAALFLLLADDIPMGEFQNIVEIEKSKLISQPQRFSESDLWKYRLLNDNSLDHSNDNLSNVFITPSIEEKNRIEDSSSDTSLSNSKRSKTSSKMNHKYSMNYVPKSMPVEIGLAQSMHIPLDHSGALISFSSVKQWVNPTATEMDCLRRRIRRQWMEPLQLKQQDIVKATGVGAPYICYLFKDPDNPNMTQRRRVEAYSVLKELLDRYNHGEVNDDDFIALKNLRIQNRYLKRQNGMKHGSHEFFSEDKNNMEKKIKNNFEDYDHTTGTSPQNFNGSQTPSRNIHSG